MTHLSEIENSIAKLHGDDFIKFREWFWEYENEKWDGFVIKRLNAFTAKKLPLSRQSVYVSCLFGSGLSGLGNKRTS